MARLPQEEVEFREEWLRQLFTKDPELSMEAANEKITEKFGISMRPQKIYEIRRIVRAELKGGAQFMVPAARRATKIEHRVEAIPVPIGSEEAVAQVVEFLADRGMFGGQVASIGEGYVVVTMSTAIKLTKEEPKT